MLRLARSVGGKLEVQATNAATAQATSGTPRLARFR